MSNRHLTFRDMKKYIYGIVSDPDEAELEEPSSGDSSANNFAKANCPDSTFKNELPLGKSFKLP